MKPLHGGRVALQDRAMITDRMCFRAGRLKASAFYDAAYPLGRNMAAPGTFPPFEHSMSNVGFRQKLTLNARLRFGTL
ncbi:hypothetical protein [Sphingomonas sp. S2M10]|uniref:hypothetical protein n=1 Tax=Sphingomonas sp. S2M10 TaxID=2705010 RepID=UPI0014570ED1|nr:hypothetical protein [Sphingomonas sp. S2M10]